jgi:hypothetical protein
MNPKFTALADRLITENDLDTISVRHPRGHLDVVYGYAVKISEAVRGLSGDEMLELAHTADSGNTVSTQEALKGLHIDVNNYTASMMIHAAAAAALLIIIAGPKRRSVSA